jgi:hypothetical protein
MIKLSAAYKMAWMSFWNDRQSKVWIAILIAILNWDVEGNEVVAYNEEN